MVAILAIYEFFVYRIVSHRSFYNKSFNITTAILPFFISSIILCLQSNLVITLGTIGALAIIRFRTSVKDPVDMLYLLWYKNIQELSQQLSKMEKIGKYSIIEYDADDIV